MPKNMTSETCAQMLVGEQSHGCVLSRNFQFKGVERKGGGEGSSLSQTELSSYTEHSNDILTVFRSKHLIAFWPHTNGKVLIASWDHLHTYIFPHVLYMYIFLKFKFFYNYLPI